MEYSYLEYAKIVKIEPFYGFSLPVRAVQRIIEKVVTDYLSGEFYLTTMTCPSL
jgi:hypothetical protein